MNDGKEPETEPQQQEQPPTTWQFKSDDSAPVQDDAPVPSPAPRAETVTWEASEFIAHEKSFGWYAILVLGTALLASLTLFWLRDLVSTFVVIVAAIIFGIVASRKPRVLPYRLDDHGVTVGNAFRPYHDFKSYAPLQEGAVSSVVLLPLKRFMPPLSIYFAPEDEEKIIKTLAAYLPFDQAHQYDMVDRVIQRIRF
jgi:hypothetical protein